MFNMGGMVDPNFEMIHGFDELLDGELFSFFCYRNSFPAIQTLSLAIESLRSHRGRLIPPTMCYDSKHTAVHVCWKRSVDLLGVGQVQRSHDGIELLR